MARIRTHNNRRRAKAEKAAMAGHGFWRVGLIQVSRFKVGGPNWAERGATPEEIAADLKAGIEAAMDQIRGARAW